MLKYVWLALFHMNRRRRDDYFEGPGQRPQKRRGNFERERKLKHFIYPYPMKKIRKVIEKRNYQVNQS